MQYTSQDPVTKALLIRTSATTHSMAFGEPGAVGEQRLAVLGLDLCRAPFASSPCSVQLASVRRPSHPSGHTPATAAPPADARALWLPFKPTSTPGQAVLEMPANFNLTPPGM